MCTARLYPKVNGTDFFFLLLALETRSNFFEVFLAVVFAYASQTALPHTIAWYVRKHETGTPSSGQPDTNRGESQNPGRVASWSQSRCVIFILQNQGRRSCFHLVRPPDKLSFLDNSLHSTLVTSMCGVGVGGRGHIYFVKRDLLFFLMESYRMSWSLKSGGPNLDKKVLFVELFYQ